MTARCVGYKTREYMYGFIDTIVHSYSSASHLLSSSLPRQIPVHHISSSVLHHSLRSCAARSVPPGPTDPQVPSRTAALPASDQRPHRTHAHPCRVTHHAGSSASIAASLTFGGRYKALCIGASEVDGPAFARADAHDAARGQRLTRPVGGLDHMHAAVRHVRRSREGLANVNRRHEAIANR